MKNNSAIVINQALHGYLNGHSLLASSLSLSPADERRMLILSDMSGASMTRGFETYITGYRMAKGSIYVLAKTWYAPEMERPGCVWTHSLLIDCEDLRSISKPQNLLHLFKRPRKLLKYDDYLGSIFFDNIFIDKHQYGFESFQPVECAEIITSLYENPTKQIFIPAQESAQYEELILTAWEYQGARLRQEIAFCTGSISNRSSIDVTFDIQVIPQKSLNKIEKEKRENIIVRLDKLSRNTYTDWVENLVWKQIFKEDPSGLKLYLNECDSDIQNGREAYPKLIKIFINYDHLLQGFGDYKSFINLIAQEFPDKDDAIALKSFFLQNEHRKNYRNYWQDDMFIQSLCTTKNFDSFDAIQPKLKAKAVRLSDEQGFDHIEPLLTNILASSLNPLGDAFIEGIVEGLDTNNLGVITQNREHLLRILIYNSPLLGTHPFIWNTTDYNQEERLDVLASSLKLTPSIIKNVVQLLISGKKNTLAHKVFDRFGDLAVVPILDWVNQHKSDADFEIDGEWIDQLPSRPKAILDWLLSLESENNLDIKILAWSTRFLDPTSDFVIEYGASIWLRKSYWDLSLLSEKDVIEYSVFLLSIAMSLDGYSSSELIAKTFLTVYNAARDNKLSYVSWQRISGKLPEIAWYQSWDNCESLRRGLVKKYLQGQIRTQDFVRAIDQADVFEEMIQYSLDNKQLRNIIKRDLLKDQSENPILSSTQQNILKRYF